MPGLVDLARTADREGAARRAKSESGSAGEKPPTLALPGNLAHSLRHLDDAQLDELLRATAAEARRRGSIAGQAGQGPGQAASKSAPGPASSKRAGPVSPGLERIVRAALDAGVKPAAIARQSRLQRAEVQRIARSEPKR